MADFYHVFIVTKPNVKYQDLEAKMNLAVDWFRCNNNTWILYTSSDHNKWVARLRPLVEPEGDLFICRLDTTKRNGWMTQEFWDWLGKKRG